MPRHQFTIMTGRCSGRRNNGRSDGFLTKRRSASATGVCLMCPANGILRQGDLKRNSLEQRGKSRILEKQGTGMLCAAAGDTVRNMVKDAQGAKGAAPGTSAASGPRFLLLSIKEGSFGAVYEPFGAVRSLAEGKSDNAISASSGIPDFLRVEPGTGQACVSVDVLGDRAGEGFPVFL